MRILHFVESTATGTLTMIALLANHQAKRGHAVTVVYCPRQETPEKLKERFDLRVALVNVGPFSIISALGITRRLRRIVNDRPPHWVIMHSSIAGFVGRLGLVGLSAQMLVVPHCTPLLRTDLHWAALWVIEVFERIAGLVPATYAACSESERVVLASLFSERRVRLVENAVRLAHTSVPSWAERERLVICVGGIRAQKDPASFAAIAESVRKRHGSVRFRWVGDGPAEARRTLEAAGVEVTGWLDAEGVKKCLLEARIYLSTARWEGMPVALIEAMDAGCVPVVSACSGNRDVVEHSVSGACFHTQDEAVHYLSRGLNDESHWRVLSSAGVDLVRGRFSAERYLDQIDRLLGVGRVA